MNREAFKTFIEDNLPERSLIIVSNREPYIHRKAGTSIRSSKPAGGLTSAIDDVLKRIGGTWVAWGSGDGDRDVVDKKDRVPVPPKKPAYTLKRVWLSDEEVENYYHGFSNHVLWPLCHMTLDKVYFRRRYWNDYIRANRKFAKAITEEATKDSVVWIHDYHLCLVPKILRSRRPDLTIAHFWHIPWPGYNIFRVCPHSKDVLEGMLRNDIIGFQIPLFVHAFMGCVKRILPDAETDFDNYTVTYNGHRTKLNAFPISVDYHKFHSLASLEKTSAKVEKFEERHKLSDKFIGIGVDRLEYTKGLTKRFQAIDLFLDEYPEAKGKFTFVQIAVPTRMQEPYISYRAKVEGLVKKINKKYSTGDWTPIIYRDTKAEHEELVAYYRMADLAIISSIYDGMNLVAKEYVASKVDKNGVLLLSEFAGAAEELEGAILVNPFDIEEFAESINTALTMPYKEKISRMSTLQAQVQEKDIFRWIADVLVDITMSHLRKKRKCLYLFDHLDDIPRDNIFLFLDYDGTLTPIADTPDKALLTKTMRSLIRELRNKLPVAIVSGRSLKDVMNMVKIKEMIYAGNHGAEVWYGNRLVIGHSGSKEKLNDIIIKLKRSLASIDGAIVEDKGITASIHFRKVAPEDLSRLFNIFWSIANKYKRYFRVTSGRKVLEIRPLGIWNKGDAVNLIWKKFDRSRFPIYIGDDVTDEDAFKVLKGEGISIAIGESLDADYYMKNQGELRRFLNWINEK
jgi:alpha,alpha-trehalose-phosphate synthase [UDP-forming]/trehalose-phosphatase